MDVFKAPHGNKGVGGPVDSGIRYKELKKENETLKLEMESLEAAKVMNIDFCQVPTTNIK